jgi:hypothetical protein
MQSQQTLALEILINSYQVTTGTTEGDSYEFILNEDLQVIECVKLESINKSIIQSIKDAKTVLNGYLFELNHVRVNPRLDNTYIVKQLTDALSQIGVKVANQPKQDSMAVCFKPLGEISDNVRFYLNQEGKLVFLSPSTRPKLIYSKPSV